MDWELMKQVDSAEEYAERRLNAIASDDTSTERSQYPASDVEALAMLQDEYYDMLDADSGAIEQENAEIEWQLKREKGEKPN